MSDDPEDVEEKARRGKVQAARREARAAIPAVYVDTWATLVWPEHLRFVLGEWLAGGPHYRAAFVMEFDEAERFAKDLLERVERKRREYNEEADNSGAEPED